MVRREEVNLYIKDKSWTCAHCSVHYLAPVIRKGAIDHCKAAYVSFFPPSSPVLLLLVLFLALTLFFGFMKARNPSHNQLPLRHHDGTNYAQTSCIANCLCLLCPDTGVTRLRTLGAFVPHLRDA